MKNITLSANEALIRRAREVASARNTTLNSLFREWLKELAETRERSERLDSLLQRLESCDAGRTFSRGEMNER
jgi:hypothetical protein